MTSNTIGGNPSAIDKRILVEGDVTPKPNMDRVVSNPKSEKMQKKVLPRGKI